MTEYSRSCGHNEEGVRFYRPSPPQRIIEHLDEKKEKIKNMLPALENIFANQGEASVEIYKAKSGFKSAMTEFFSKAKQDDEFIWIGVAPIFEKVLPMTILTFVKRCDALGLRERGIMQTGESIQYKLKKHEYRYMSKKHISPTMFMQHRNMVAICIPTSPLCTIIIHSKEIAQSYKSYFEFMWKFAKKNYSPR